jgi:hypothetical protein
MEARNMIPNTQRSSWCVVATVTTALVMGVAIQRGDSQTVQTSRVMQQKLAESQQLLAAVVTSNWATLNQRTQALQSLTNAPGWQVLRTREYRDYTAAFQKATQALTAAAGQRDQRAAVTSYNQLVSSCVECHRYLARARIAAAKP